MLYNIKLGITDVIKNFKKIILFITVMVVITILLTSSTISLKRIINENDKAKSMYSVIPISYETKDFINIKNNIYNIYRKGGYTLFQPEYGFEKNSNINYNILLGKFQKNKENAILFSMDSSDINEFKNLNIEYKIIPSDSIDYEKLEKFDILNIYEGSICFFEIESVKDLSKLKLTEHDLITIIENTIFINEDIEKNIDKEFESATLNSNFVIVKDKYDISSEYDFIIKFIYLYIFLLIIFTSLCFYISIKSLFKDLFKEYRIHIIFGATKFNIFIRNSVLTVSIIIINFILIQILNKFNFNYITNLNIIINLVYFVVLESIILYVLLLEDLNKNILGGSYD